MIEHYDAMKAVYEKIDGNKTPQVKIHVYTFS